MTINSKGDFIASLRDKVLSMDLSTADFSRRILGSSFFNDDDREKVLDSQYGAEFHNVSTIIRELGDEPLDRVKAVLLTAELFSVTSTMRYSAMGSLNDLMETSKTSLIVYAAALLVPYGLGGKSDDVLRRFSIDYFHPGIKGRRVRDSIAQLDNAMSSIGLPSLHVSIKKQVENKIWTYAKPADASFAQMLNQHPAFAPEIIFDRSPLELESLFGKLLETLDKITLSPKTFPDMLEYMRRMIEHVKDNIGNGFDPVRHSQWLEDNESKLFSCVVKMACKPGYRKMGVLVPALMDMLENVKTLDRTSMARTVSLIGDSGSILTQLSEKEGRDGFLKEDLKTLVNTLQKLNMDGSSLYAVVKTLKPEIEGDGLSDKDNAIVNALLRARLDSEMSL